MKSLAARLNLEDGEGRLVAVLLALAFCIGLTRLFNATASSALFLVTFNATSLPYIYILVAVVIPLIGFITTRLESRVPLITLLAGNLLGYLLVLGGLRLSMALTTHPWPIFALAVWSEVGWVVTNLALWGLAGRLLNVRQAKRLFGLIGAGGVVAAVAGGLLMPTLVSLIGTPNLLWGSVTTLALSFGLLMYAARVFKSAAARPSDPPVAEAAANAGLSTRSRYIILIVVLCMLSYAAFYFVDNIFYHQVEQQFRDEAQLAGFLGVFLAVMNLLTVVVNLFLVSPIISRLGMRFGLLLMPGLTAVVSGTMLLTGLLFAAPGLIFGLAVLNDLLDWVLRDTVFKTAVLILYQPLPPSLRLRVQTLVESVAQPIAQGLAGLALLGLGLLVVNASVLNLVLLILLGVCVVLAILLGRAYAPALLAALSTRALNFDGAALAITDVTSLEILRHELASSTPSAVIYAFDKLEELNDPALTGLLANWLNHPAPEVRQNILLRLERLNLKAVADKVRALLKTEEVPAVKAAALRALAALGKESAGEQVESYLDDAVSTVRVGAMVAMLRNGGTARAENVVNQLTQMIASPQVEKRVQAAKVLGGVGQGRHSALVLELMKDDEPKVRQAAMAAAGQIKSPRLWPSVIEGLNDQSVREEAVAALVGGSDRVLLSLQSTLSQPELKTAVKLRLLRIVGRIRGEAAVVLLKDWIGSKNRELRHQALAELERCQYRAGDTDRQRIEQAIANEVQQAAETLAALLDVQVESDDLLERALLEIVADHRACVLSLLSFLLDARMFARVQVSLTHATPEKRAYGLEVLESLLDKELRAMVLPLMEAVPPEKMLARLPFKLERQTRVERLKALAEGNQWVAVCARQAMGETSMMSLIEKVLILRTVSIFAGVPESILAEVAALLEESELKLGETLFSKGEAGDCLYIIVQGRLRVHDGERLLSQLDERDVVGEMAVLDSSPRLASVTADTQATLLKLDQGALYELMADRVEVARGIIHVLMRRLRQNMQDFNDLQAQLDVQRQ
jgi:ATP:ADP antiporter, AAA family